MIWFNPLPSLNVSTDVAKTFLQLLDKHFSSSNSLHQIFSHNTIKVSYCCAQNSSNIIKSHNKKLISSNNQIILPCNYRKKKRRSVHQKENVELMIQFINVLLQQLVFSIKFIQELHKESLECGFTITIRLSRTSRKKTTPTQQNTFGI